jgi:protein arginine kinase activator
VAQRRKCDRCDRPATVHSVEIVKSEKVEKHLCDQCAAEEGMAIKAVHTPINELLTNFVKLHSGATTAGRDTSCDSCGMTFSDFREHSLLGCPSCYKAFESQIGPLLERAHEGATHHLGKVPRRAGAGDHRQAQLMRMRKRLELAVEAEDYELAARLRDDINTYEESV